MASHDQSVPLPGSARAPLPNAHVVGPAALDERLEVTVRVRPRSSLQALATAKTMTAHLPHERQYMSRDDYAARYGADPKDLDTVAAFAKRHGLAVVESSSARRSLVLSGTVAALSNAFGVVLEHYEHPHGSYRGRTGAIHVPANLAPIVEGVFGLDDRPQCQPHFQRWKTPETLQAQAKSVAFTPPQLAQVYRFPTGLDGQGQCLAIIELGGGYRKADLQAYFTTLGLPVPTVQMVLVDHAHNHPTTPDGPDSEVMLDIEVAAAIAPQARIVVYFAPNTDQGLLDAITTAVHDTVHQPSIISLSWGAPESQWTPQALQQIDQAFQAAAALGLTVCCAAGDNGSGDGARDGQVHVDFPASSPFALGCGGTRLDAHGTTVTREIVWNDNPNSATGGGVSDIFPLPQWQQGAQVPPSANDGGQRGRGVPDIAGDAAPATGYRIRVDGHEYVIGGTSAVAPLWAGLIALLNQHLGHPVGYLNPLLYGALANQGVCRDITTGNNGAYAARPGWDACTGWGVPDGAKLLQALSS
jgi:kumamolisin